MITVEIRGLTHRFKGAAPPVLRDLNLALRPGVVGLVGPNGAGKSTLFRLLAGMLNPVHGDIRIMDRAPIEYVRRHPIGLLPELPAFADYLTVREFLTGLADLLDAEPVFDFGTAELMRRRLDRLSLGQKRRVELAATLIGNPRLILLDEPTNGLDPAGVHILRDAIHSIIDPARLLIIASHHLDELQRLIDWLVVIEAGSVVLSCSVADALDSYGSLDHVFHQLISSNTSA